MADEPMTVKELAALPSLVPLRTAARVLQIGRDMAYEMARNEAFPCTVLHHGRFLRVRKVDLMRELGLNLDGTPLTPPAQGAA